MLIRKGGQGRGRNGEEQSPLKYNIRLDNANCAFISHGRLLHSENLHEVKLQYNTIHFVYNDNALTLNTFRNRCKSRLMNRARTLFARAGLTRKEWERLSVS